MAWGSTRVSIYIEDYLGYLLVGALLLTLVGGFLTYHTHVDPGTEVETVEESSWTASAAFSHEATITEETDVFEAGAVHEQRPAYFRQLSPVLNGTFTYHYEATESGTVEADIDLRLVTQAQADGFVYWREEQALDSATHSSLAPGEPLTVPFSVNVSAAQEQIREIEDQLGASPGEPALAVEAIVHWRGEKNGMQYNETSASELGIDVDGAIYRVESDGRFESGDQQFAEQTTTASHGFVRSVLGPLLMLVGIIAGTGLAYGSRTDWFVVDDRTRRLAQYRADREEFDEWISPGTVPVADGDTSRIEVESLAALVDVAIDSNRRVIECKEQDRFVVLVDDWRYYFDAPESDSSVPAETTGETISADGQDAEPRADEAQPADQRQ